ncbi:hypothetical protein SDC9_75657 [bioreactor metagenome]|uniref:DUF2680 domain-containing protein n=1 Tax=bioreactor metagenome TaxID=1076179 RepID=A0A644YM99_9ZZZZ
MNKKIIVSTLVAAALVTFSGFAYAAEQNNTTPEWFKSMTEWKKEQVKEQVEQGNLTEEEAKQWNENIDAMEEYHKENGFGPGACGTNTSEDGTNQGVGRGMMKNFKGNSNFGPGMMENFNSNSNYGSGMMGNFNGLSQK